MTQKNEPYVLRFDGRVPVVRWYPSRVRGIKARRKYRKLGFHVQLLKVQIPENKVQILEELPDAKTEPDSRDNNNFFTRLTDRFRRRSRLG